jgi:hypothetical protein
MQQSRFLTITLTVVLVSLSLVFSLPAMSESMSFGSGGQPDDEGMRGLPDGHRPPPRGHKPPPEAYKACEGKTAGATAQLITPRGDTINGTCKELDGKMVLVPSFDKNRKGPPPEVPVSN